MHLPREGWTHRDSKIEACRKVISSNCTANVKKKVLTSDHTPPFYRRRTSEIEQSEESTMMCAIRPSMLSMQLAMQLASCLWRMLANDCSTCIASQATRGGHDVTAFAASSRESLLPVAVDVSCCPKRSPRPTCLQFLQTGVQQLLGHWHDIMRHRQQLHTECNTI